MAEIFIDGVRYEYRADSRNLLDVCLSLGLDVPYFCWHPAMGSVGACRQCAVKVYRNEADTQGRIVMSCMTPATPGLRVSVNDPEVKAFRSSVAEWLMVNHPHDCPVCDEGGECHLQDMVVMTGHTQRRARFPKRTFRDQNLGPFIAQEMNRCIQCYRCVRFYKDYAGGPDFGVFGWHDRLFFGRFEEGTLQSPFSGNLVEVCPTGVFTDKSFRAHSVRAWDLQTAPSVCELCSLGCNTLPGERYGTLRRIRNRYNGKVNGYFLCDRGRYGYEYVGSPLRLHVPRLRLGGAESTPTSAADALERLVAAMRGKRLLGIGSPRASLESNFALRELVGADRFYQGLARTDFELLRLALELLRSARALSASLAEARHSDAVLLLGEDVLQTAPLLALELRQASRGKPLREASEQKPPIPAWDDGAARSFIQDEKGPFIIATPAVTGLEGLATASLRAGPTEIARFGYAVARALDPSRPEVAGLDAAVHDLAERTARELRAAERPLVVSGTGLRSPDVLHAAAAVADALAALRPAARFVFTLPECNSMGAALLGAAGSLDDVQEVVRRGAVDAIVVLENDLYRRAELERVNEILDGAPLVAALDHVETETTRRAHVVLPASTIAESEGTLVNNEGRAQRFFKVLEPKDASLESWRWLQKLGAAMRGEQDGRGLDSVLKVMAAAEPRLAGVLEAAPPSSFRIQGQKVPRQPQRYSGRTAMNADVSVREPKPVDDKDSALAFSMEGFRGEAPSSVSAGFWSPGWNSVQSLSKFQDEVGGHLHGGDPGVLLVSPGSGAAAGTAPKVPEATAARAGEWLILPSYHLFGSEELSSMAPSVASLAPAGYLGLGEQDLKSLGIAEGGTASVRLNGFDRRLTVRAIAGLPAGIALLPVGLSGSPWVDLPARARIQA